MQTWGEGAKQGPGHLFLSLGIAPSCCQTPTIGSCGVAPLHLSWASLKTDEASLHHIWALGSCSGDGQGASGTDRDRLLPQLGPALSSWLLWSREQSFQGRARARVALPCIVKCPLPLLFCTQLTRLMKVCACKHGALPCLACHSCHWAAPPCRGEGADAASPGFCSLSSGRLLSCLFFLCLLSTIFRLLKISWFYCFVLIAKSYLFSVPSFAFRFSDGLCLLSWPHPKVYLLPQSLSPLPNYYFFNSDHDCTNDLVSLKFCANNRCCMTFFKKNASKMFTWWR